MKMERRKSSLVFGSRTGRNILKGKNIRESEDGVHNFDDYWTDTSSKNTEKSIFPSDRSQTKQSPSVSDARLATLRQSVRKSNDSHSQTEVGDRIDRNELTKSPFKSVKRNISSSDKDVISSPIKKLILSPRRQQNIQGYSDRNLSNKSTVTDYLGSHHEVESNVSNTIQHSTSNVNSIREQTENTAVPQDGETSDEAVNITLAQNSDESSENVDKEECIQSRTFRHLRHSVRDQSTSYPILLNSSEKVRETTTKKGPASRNLNDSLKILQNSTCDASAIGKYSENTISKFSKKRNKMEETFVMQKNIPGANLNNTEIRILSKSKLPYKVIDSDDGFATERSPLSHKIFKERNKALGVSKQVSKSFTTSFGYRTTRKMGNTFQVSNKFAKYDEYDAKIMEMIRRNEQNLRSESFVSVATNPIEEIKINSVTSKKPIQSTEESYDQIALERSIKNSNKPQNSRNVRSSNRVQTRSQLKSSELADRNINELSRKSTITENGNSEVVNISSTSQHSHQSQTKHDLSSDSNKKLESSSKGDKSGQLRAEDKSLRSKSKAVKSPSKRKSNVKNITSAKKHSTEHQNMPRSRLNISAETSPRPVSESGSETDEANGIRIDEARSEANITHTDELDELLNVDSRTRVDKTNEKLKATETFIKDNIKRGVDSPEVLNVTISRLDNKRKKHVKKSKEKGKTLEYSSKDKIQRVKNKTSASLDNKKKKHVGQDTEDIPEIIGSDEFELPPRKKKNKKKTAVPSDSVPLRKSSRLKFPRLAAWRHERLQFRVEDGIINFVGIDPGIAEDDGAIRQLYKIMERRKKAKERKAKPKNFKLEDFVQKKKVSVPVVKKFRYTPWDKGYQEDKCPFRIKKLFETSNSSSGFIQIEINEEKPVQYMPEDDLNLTLIKGNVRVTVQDNVIDAEEKDMIMIPRCMPYSLKNVGSKRALLVFCVSKFQYLESLE